MIGEDPVAQQAQRMTPATCKYTESNDRWPSSEGIKSWETWRLFQDVSVLEIDLNTCNEIGQLVVPSYVPYFKLREKTPSVTRHLI
jgi:hypothetical protein